MKKLIAAALAFGMGCCMLTACTDTVLYDNYIPEEGRCVLSIPAEYSLAFEGEAEVIDAYMINGAVCSDSMNYYSVLRGEQFRILVPEGLTQDQNYLGQTLVYWQLNETRYRAADSAVSETFTCTEDTVITPVYHAFRPVGFLMCELDEESGLPTLNETQLIAEDGTLIEQSGVIYLHGSYEFDDSEAAWQSNAAITDFTAEQELDPEAEEAQTYLTMISLSLRVPALSGGTPYVLDVLYEIEGGLGYMFSDYTAARVIRGAGTTCEIALGNNTLRCTFVG